LVFEVEFIDPWNTGLFGFDPSKHLVLRLFQD